MLMQLTAGGNSGRKGAAEMKVNSFQGYIDIVILWYHNIKGDIVRSQILSYISLNT